MQIIVSQERAHMPQVAPWWAHSRQGGHSAGLMARLDDRGVWAVDDQGLPVAQGACLTSDQLGARASYL